jgi:hypothetical protein
MYQLFQILELAICLEQETLLILAPAQCDYGSVFLARSEMSFGNRMFTVKDHLYLRRKSIH